MNWVSFELGLIVGLQISCILLTIAFLAKRFQARRWIRQSLDDYEIKERKKRGL